MTYRLDVDPDICLSSGKCVADAPGLFRFDADEIVSVVPGAALPADGVLLDLARACPSGALRLFDGEQEIDP